MCADPVAQSWKGKLLLIVQSRDTQYNSKVRLALLETFSFRSIYIFISTQCEDRQVATHNYYAINNTLQTLLYFLFVKMLSTNVALTSRLDCLHAHRARFFCFIYLFGL